MSAQYFLLWLQAPLQSWGFDSKFGRRDSLDFPTKSGVLGLICAARGAGGTETSWLNDWDELDMQIIAYVPQDKKGQALMRLPLLRDFHMVGSGYDEKDPWQSLHIPKTSEGKKAVGGGSKLTYRYYLQDMAFAVILQVPQQHFESSREALQHPVWDLYLGRKNCAPTELIYQGDFATSEQAEQAAHSMAEQKARAPSFQVLQGVHDEGSVMTLNDVPLQFGEHKKYRDRQVTIIKLP